MNRAENRAALQTGEATAKFVANGIETHLELTVLLNDFFCIYFFRF